MLKGKKVDKLYYTEIENFNRSKENIKKVKRQTMDWTKVVAKGLNPEYIKNLQKL